MNKINICQADINELKRKYQGESLDIALKKLENGYPVQYLIGNVNFYGNIIEVNENVLIPRYETEFLIDYIKKSLNLDESYNILDIGTGSGCIAISLAKIFKNAKITGIDVSTNAINVANQNKNNNNVDNVEFIHKDLFTMDNFNGYDVIVSNPPYVSKEEIVGPETKYEPQNAIFADENGLIFYKEIIKKISVSNSVKEIFFEIGMNQSGSIKKILDNYPTNYTIKVIKDLSNKDRYIHIKMNK